MEMISGLSGILSVEDFTAVNIIEDPISVMLILRGLYFWICFPPVLKAFG